LLRRIRPKTKLPLCVGFGISKKEHVKAVCKAGADGAIVGSAIVKIIEKNLKSKKLMLRKIENYIKSMKESTIL
jgi:tryptophan synthase alpha chain